MGPSTGQDGRRVHICLAASIGGHLQELLQLREVFEAHSHFFVVNDHLALPPLMQGRTHFIRHSERDLVFFVNLWECWRIFRQERPTHLISTGAGLAVPLALVGKLFGVKTLFLETFCAIHAPSLTGRLMYRIANRFAFQWQYLKSFYPHADFVGPIFRLRDRG